MDSIIIYNQVKDSSSPDALDVLDQVKFVEMGLTELGYQVVKKPITENFYDELKDIALKQNKDNGDVVFNLVESIRDHDELLHLVPSILDVYSAKYSGCSTEGSFLTGNKKLAKEIMSMVGIPVPLGYLFNDVTSLKKNLNSLKKGRKYIVKPVSEDGSVGITEDSVFTYNGTLPEICQGKKDNAWLIEDYIDGREFNVSVLAGKVLSPAEIIFQNYTSDMPKVVSYKAKWEEDSFQYNNTVRSLDPIYSESLKNKIISACEKCWAIFHLHGYARVDLRVDDEENIYVMEVNANPCISPDGGFVAACHHINLSDKEIIKLILEDSNNK
ncbi:MAG: ATP-grasp domain-containing protein [Bacteroidales bacterium]